MANIAHEKYIKNWEMAHVKKEKQFKYLLGQPQLTLIFYICYHVMSLHIYIMEAHYFFCIIKHLFLDILVMITFLLQKATSPKILNS